MVDLTSYIKQVKNLRNPQKPTTNILFFLEVGMVYKENGWVGAQLF